jgi:DNA-binding PadR family transcriptional regulator
LRGSITFTGLKKLLSVSDGNLSVHLKKLEDADFITVEKKFEGRKPQTTYKLTELGKKEFIAYLNKMEEVLKNLREANNGSRSEVSL